MKRKFYSLALFALLLLLFSPVAKAQIELVDPNDVNAIIPILANSQGQLFEGEDRFQLMVECSDPGNNLSGSFDFALEHPTVPGDNIFQFSGTNSNEFSINCNGKGKSISKKLDLTTEGLNLVNAATELGDSFDVPVSLRYTGSNDPGFQSLGFELQMTSSSDAGSDDDESPVKPVDLEDGITSVTMPSFGTYNINDVEETDLKVTYDLKIAKTIYDNFADALDEDEDILEEAKKLAEQFGLKVNMRNLRKLARQEVRAAGRGKTGAEKEAAQEAAAATGISKLVDTIVAKLPPLPSTQTNDAAERERLRTIRKAKKANILQGLDIELDEITDGTEDGVAVKCLSFCITLPIQLCPAEGNGQTLIIAGHSFALQALEAGESITADIPVKVLGLYKKFFGDVNKKGKTNGKITIPLTIENPAE